MNKPAMMWMVMTQILNLDMIIPMKTGKYLIENW